MPFEHVKFERFMASRDAFFSNSLLMVAEVGFSGPLTSLDLGSNYLRGSFILSIICVAVFGRLMKIFANF